MPLIRAIHDTHSEPKGRLLAQEWLNSGLIKVFFIEWSKPMTGNLAECFTGLNSGDAHPNLKELAELCTSTDIEVVPIDLPVDKTLERLNGLGDGYTYNELSVFQPWGKAVRDRHAATVVGDYMRSNPGAWDHALLLYGTDHFKHEEGRNAPGLHMLIDLQFAKGNVIFVKEGPSQG